MKKIAINGFGRIGRLVYRQLHALEGIEVVAINDLTDTKTLSYLLEHDSAQGKFLSGEISCTHDSINVDNKIIKVVSERDPSKLPWKSLNIDLVIECTGLFASKEASQAHIKAGAKKVVISAPAKGDLKTIVFNVNHKTLNESDKIISGASCTTNCLAPVVDILDKSFGFVKGLMCTIHSVTNDQRILDLPHKDPRRGRSGLANIIPTTTGAAIAVGLVLPNLKGKLDGMAMRVPTITGSSIYLTCELSKKVNKDMINKAFEDNMSETLKYETNPIVSTDIIGETHGSILDPALTKVMDVDGKQMVQLVSWYDNENSYVSQLVRTIKYFISL